MTDEFRKIGRQFTLGVLDIFFILLCWLAIFLLVISYIKPIDDCDRTWYDRCDMRVVTDNKTGQQYLVTRGGGIIERKTK